MKPLSRCSNCKGQIFPDAIVKTVAIIQSPQHIALVYTCPHCGNKSKVVAEQGDWEERKEEYSKERNKSNANSEKSFRGHLIELDAIHGADDLIALWNSLPEPALREAAMNKCKCDECQRRLYG